MHRSYFLVLLLTVVPTFALAQSNTTTTTTQTTTTQTSQSAAPSGTVAKRKHTEAVVQPAPKPVKVDAATIRSAQQQLADKGYKPGPADGVFGPRTRAALRKFQADEGLRKTGRLDQDTLAKLNVGGTKELGAAPSDIGRGGKAAGHDIKEGHPVEAGKAIGKGTGHAAKKVGQGVKSEAVTTKDKLGQGVSKIGEKVSGKTPSNKNETIEPSENNPK